ncbi:hypothetical protein [Variovorax sp. JS1663]|uniref:hypothetical protein n=1 Tax=Variovorax sp. JS1663 TaxID=1851577 RepID=UPI000B343B4F|nr:hypothetical protein [Variovorax sp. JS1663]OUL98458.1 hypothetical protein A8M77_31410 [Variovorax sp. JS1663]
MHVIDHSTLPRLQDAGRQRFAAAHRALGFAPFELWVETLELDAGADILPLESARVMLVLSGHGKLFIDGAGQRFHAPCSLMLPPGAEGRVVNIGAEPLRLVTGFIPVDPPPV